MNETIQTCDPPVTVTVPDPRLTEVERARLEDPTFREVQARALAKARDQVYDRERHGPFDESDIIRPYKPPTLKVSKLGPTQTEIDAIMRRFKDYGGPRLVRDFKAESANDR